MSDGPDTPLSTDAVPDQPPTDAVPDQPPGTMVIDGTEYAPQSTYESVLDPVRRGGGSFSKWAAALGLGRVWTTLKANAGWSVSLAAGVLITIKVYFAAEGNLNVALTIVSSSATASALFGIATQAVAALLTGFPLLWILYAVDVWERRLRERYLAQCDPSDSTELPPLWTPSTTWSLIILVASFVFSFFFAYWVTFVLALAVLLLYMFMGIRSYRNWKNIAIRVFQTSAPNELRVRDYRALQRRPLPLESLVLVLITVLLLIPFSTTMWLPAEAICYQDGRKYRRLSAIKYDQRPNGLAGFTPPAGCPERIEHQDCEVLRTFQRE